METSERLFFELVRSGLWGTVPAVADTAASDWKKVYRTASEQKVTGLICSALERCGESPVPQEVRFRVLRDVLSIESACKKLLYALNEIARLFNENSVEYCVVKGPGVAACYENPMWRTPGDIDFFLPKDSYEKAKSVLIAVSEKMSREDTGMLHVEFLFKGVEVELHGCLSTTLSRNIDTHLGLIQNRLFTERRYRTWDNMGVEIKSPDIDDDLIYLFTHFLKHFYRGGLGIRQICDWARFLHRYSASIDTPCLQKRLEAMGLVEEWRVFGCFAVSYLGLPEEEMPLYDGKDAKKADLLWRFFKKVGNFGQNRTPVNHNYPYLVRKVMAFMVKSGYFIEHMRLFPSNSVRFFASFMGRGLQGIREGR